MTPLRQRMLEDMGIRHLAENIQSAYLQQIAAYARYFNRSPNIELTGAARLYRAGSSVRR